MAKTTKRVGWHGTTTYKDRIADALPLGELCEVQDQAGAAIGALRRLLDPTRTDNAYGTVVCDWKIEPGAGNSAPLFPERVTH